MNKPDFKHTSVFLNEGVDFLQVVPGKTYIDATLGGGGHTFEILAKGGKVLGIDLDEDALLHVRSRARKENIAESDLSFYKGNFSEISKAFTKSNVINVSGVIYDLGVSSYQLDTPERGFSFRNDGPLDMRMGKKLTVTAEDLINGLSKKELVTLFERLGEEPRARMIAEKIVKFRKKQKIQTTKQLAGIIGDGMYDTRIDPATRVFQALRIAVNDELNSLRESLKKSVKIVEDGGRIVVISFHSLEDRIVKEAFKSFSEAKLGEILTEKPITPTDEERIKNPRSRSAKMRVFEKHER